MRLDKVEKRDPNPPIQPAAPSTTRQFEPLIDSREAAALLRMHHKTLERKARAGEVHGYQIAGRWFFRASELEAWLARQCNNTCRQSVREN